MGQPGRERSRSSTFEWRRTLGTETSQYREEEEATARPGVAASGTGRLPKPSGMPGGVVGPADAGGERSRSPLGRGARDGESPVGEADGPFVAEFLSSARPEKSGVKLGGPPPKARILPCDR